MRLALAALLSVIGILGAGCAVHVNDILTEARKGDPTSVKRAVVELGAVLREKEENGIAYDAADEEAILYLKDVATKSSDPVNRASAVSSLALLERPRLTDLFLTVLDDRSWIVQLDAARGLAVRPDPIAAEPLARRLETEQRMEVRIAIIKALAATGGDAALGALLTVFLDPTSRWKNMKIAAFEGVRALSGRAIRFEDTEGWQAYYDQRFPAKPEPPGTPPAGGQARKVD